MDKKKEDSQLINFSISMDADCMKTMRNKIEKNVKRIESFQLMGDGRLHVSCYAEPNKLMTCLHQEEKRPRLVHWQCGESFTVHLSVDNKDWMMVQKKLLKIILQGYCSITKKDDNGLDILGCCEPNTLMNWLREAENIAHLLYWRDCATNLCPNTFCHQFGIGSRGNKDKAQGVENPSFVNYSDNRGNCHNDKSQPCATYMRPSLPRDKPYANKAGICSCCIM